MAEKLPGGHETILLVDDQETVWDFLIEALQNLGYSVILAENGLDAVEICRENPGQIDLVLLDMIMPGMDGHIPKPLDAAQMLRTIVECIRRKRHDA